ncbi:MAG TPA: response regulator [Elusimicrobiales bacterium]|nr:response regulator [Elusimicrobiales bacterium]
MAKKIFLVDDDQNTCQLMRRILEKEGYVADSCSDPLKAVQSAQKFKPDLLVLDILMPKMDGTELARRFSETPGFNTPMVFLSVLVNQSGVCNVPQPISCLAKPFTPEDLINKVREIIGAP